MSKERFELSCCLFNESNMDFIRDKKTNEEYVVLDELVPILNQQDQRIAELEEQLKNAIAVPKYKKGQMVYSPLDLQDIYKGQIDVFDCYTQKYWVFFGDDIGCEWCYESELFKTKKEAEERLKNYEKL